MIIVAAVIAQYKYPLIKAYYYEVKFNHFSKGDNVYAYKHFVDGNNTNKIFLYHLVKSNNSSDYKFVNSGLAIVSDSLNKAQSSVIGKYDYNKLIPFEFKNKSVVLRFYAIIPNWKVINHDDILKETTPPNYSLIDESYYIMAYFGVSEQQNKF